MLCEGYKNQLHEVVSINSLDESNWSSESWKNAWKDLTQDVLNDAFRQHHLVHSIFSEIGTLEQRECKSIDRVNKKMTEQRPGRENYFKVVADFLAVRVHCDVKEVREKIDRIREIVLSKDGQVHVRGSSTDRPYGFHIDTTGKYSDITQYVYVYLKEIGYPVELQIGHRFASHTFTIDSALRDNPECGKVDLWNDGFYSDVKGYILAKANEEDCSMTKVEIQGKAERLHPDGVPADLQEILNEL